MRQNKWIQTTSTLLISCLLACSPAAKQQKTPNKMKLASLVLGIDNPKESLNYYVNHLGMVLIDSSAIDNGKSYQLRFPNSPNSAALELVYEHKENWPEEQYEEHRSDNYWKYSLFVNDLERISKALASQYQTGEPYQFREIGYLLHTIDNANYKIEYIQKHFKANTTPTPSEEAYPLKESPVFGLITLRTKDPLKTIKFFENNFSLKFIERMYVPKEDNKGFTLYFLGPKHLDIPNLADPDAIENREWMYQQKETFIELQHYWGTEVQSDYHLVDKSDQRFGLKRIVFECDNLEKTIEGFKSAKLQFKEVLDGTAKVKHLRLSSPDGHNIVVRQRP